MTDKLLVIITMAIMFVAGYIHNTGEVVTVVEQSPEIEEKIEVVMVEEVPEPQKETLFVKATAYCHCAKCCGTYSDGVTSKGVDASLPGIASDPKRIPYGTVLNIPGYGTATVDDTGGAMRQSKELHIDLRFESHKEALQWGVQYLEVEVVNEPLPNREI